MLRCARKFCVHAFCCTFKRVLLSLTDAKCNIQSCEVYFVSEKTLRSFGREGDKHGKIKRGGCFSAMQLVMKDERVNKKKNIPKMQGMKHYFKG